MDDWRQKVLDDLDFLKEKQNTLEDRERIRLKVLNYSEDLREFVIEQLDDLGVIKKYCMKELRDVGKKVHDLIEPLGLDSKGIESGPYMKKVHRKLQKKTKEQLRQDPELLADLVLKYRFDWK